MSATLARAKGVHAVGRVVTHEVCVAVETDHTRSLCAISTGVDGFGREDRNVPCVPLRDDGADAVGRNPVWAQRPMR